MLFANGLPLTTCICRIEYGGSPTIVISIRSLIVKITSIETIQLEEFPAIIWIQVKTDSGHVGLGETFFGARAVAGCVHEMFAPMLIGKDPMAIE